jgi:hypothetical protein
MGESSERPAELVRLVLDFGESVEVDGPPCSIRWRSGACRRS